MTYKPWYRSVSIVGLLAGFAASVANYFHANVSDLLPVLNADLGTYINDTVALAGVIGSIVARCREAHAVSGALSSSAVPVTLGGTGLDWVRQNPLLAQLFGTTLNPSKYDVAGISLQSIVTAIDPKDPNNTNPRRGWA